MDTRHTVIFGTIYLVVFWSLIAGLLVRCAT